MSGTIVVVGVGQLGSTFAQASLKLGRVVVPVLRGANVNVICAQHEPEAIFIATGEDDLSEVLPQIPEAQRDRVVLLQNELRPDQWQVFGQTEPSVAIVWFEKKKGKLPHVVLPSVLYGIQAQFVQEAFHKMELPARTVDSRDALAHELVLKNLYILGLNLTGLRAGGTAGQLLKENSKVFYPVMDELVTLEKTLLSRTTPFAKVVLDEERLKRDLRAAIEADPTHGCAGRSAPRRLERTLEHATRIGLKVPHLTSLQDHLA